MSTPFDYKQVIRLEYAKCASDPVHFMRKFCMIQHPTKSRILFNLYPFQESVLNQFIVKNNNIILKSRQLGISTLVAGYSLWLMLFNTDKNILCVATKQDTAKNMVTKVTFMYDNLPSWLKGKKKPLENNKLSLKLTNGSLIKAVSAAADAGRSEAVSFLIIDEAAFIENIETIYGAAQQTLSTGGGCVVLSTPNGSGNWFHKQYTKATNGENSFNPLRLPWTVHPERSEGWRKIQEDDLGTRLAAQECFSGDTIIYTINGPKFIKDIEIGNKVLSHDGTYNNVIKTMSHITNKAVEIKGGLNNISKYTTLNHPFLNTHNEWEDVESIISTNNKVILFPVDVKYNNSYSTIDLKNHIISNNPKYFPLKYNDESIWLTKTNILNRNIKFDYDLGFLVGCFLSEGSLANNKVEFSFNGKTERDGFPIQIENILNSKFNINKFSYYTSKIWSGSSKLYIKDQIFHNFIKLCIQGGSLCHQKSLSEFFYDNANLETLRGIMDGVLVGDGMLKDEYNISLLLTSRKLIYDILYISNLLGIHNVTIKEGKSINPRDSSIYKPNYTLTWLKTKTNSQSKIFSDRTKNIVFNQKSSNKFIFDVNPNVSLKINPTQHNITVFNLEVENTHTYTTEYGVVHNCDCDFSSSGDTLLNKDTIKYYEDNIMEPVERRGINSNYWIFRRARNDKDYAVIVDTSRGDSNDYSTVQVIDIENMEQVAELKDMISPKDLGNLIVAIASEYNDALLIVENNNMGYQTVTTAIDRGYKNVYYSPKNDQITADQWINKMQNQDQLTPGFNTSVKTRPLIIEKFREFMDNKVFIINSRRTVDETKTFIWKNHKAQAQSGYNDDLIIPLGIVAYLRDTALRFKKNNLELTKISIANITNINDNNPQSVPNIPNDSRRPNLYTPNPYKMMVGGKVEDISWLL